MLIDDHCEGIIVLDVTATGKWISDGCNTDPGRLKHHLIINSLFTADYNRVLRV
jgi:hypothetical protein